MQLNFTNPNTNAPSRSAFAPLLLLAFLLALSAPHRTFAQAAVPEYEVDLVTMKAKDTDGVSQVDIYTRIPFSKLRFLASPDGFTARYEVSVEVVHLDDEGLRTNIVQSPIWERAVRVPNYAETQVSDRFDYSTHSVNLPAGQYVFEFQIQDQSSNESFLNETLFTVKDLTQPAALSDLLMLEKFDEKSNTIFPSVAKKIASTDNEMTLFFELYLSEPKPVKIRKEVVRLGGTVAAKSGIIEGAEIVSTSEESLVVDSRRSQHVSRIKVDEFPVGSYDVIVTALDESGAILASAQTSFEVDWSGLQDHLANLDEAISQLQYIAKTKDIRFIRDGSGENEKWKRFEDFWRRRDPTPGTARNEKMEEYYYRVSFANRRYSSIMEGWRTDRGQVMVLYGQPEHIEYHPFNFSVKPYEVWYYYRIGRRFIFVDDSGLGDYELLVPIWDETTRIR